MSEKKTVKITIELESKYLALVLDTMELIKRLVSFQGEVLKFEVKLGEERVV